MKHTITVTLSPENFDAQGNLAPQQVLTVFQKAADSHAILLGVDHDAVVAHHLLWVVTQTRYQVESSQTRRNCHHYHLAYTA